MLTFWDYASQPKASPLRPTKPRPSEMRQFPEYRKTWDAPWDCLIITDRMYSIIAAPLHHLLKKDTPFLWTESYQKTCEQLKKKLNTATCLGFYVPNIKKTIKCDAASLKGITGILSQVHDGKTQVLAYASRSLSPAAKAATKSP